jgi:nitrite reductase/ring-hydroxylating ferredoxin subunit
MEGWRTWPFAPAEGTALCTLADIPENGAKEVVFGEGYDCFRVLLLRSGEGVRAYRNRCAHAHIPLNYEPELFHVLDGGVLMCAHHGAMYRIADGVCFDGPCEGASLMPIPVAVEDNIVLIRTRFPRVGSISPPS